MGITTGVGPFSAPVGGGDTGGIGFRNISSWPDAVVESITLSPQPTAFGKAAVEVWEEVAQEDETNADWALDDADFTEDKFDRRDFAPAVTLTPSGTTGEITLTLGSGTWSASDVGTEVEGNGGVATITSQDGSAVCNATVTTDFSNTDPIASGSWIQRGITASGGSLQLTTGTGANPSYANPGGTGDRRSIITLTSSGGFINTGGGSFPENNLIDGSFPTSYHTWYEVDVTGRWLRFDFGEGAQKVISEATFYQSYTGGSTQGYWKWQGSQDAVDWEDIGGTFNLIEGALTTLSGNVIPYRYYQIYGMSGVINDYRNCQEFEFKIDDVFGVLPTNVYYAAVTSTNGQLDSRNWTNLQAMAVDETLGGQSAYYAISTDDWATVKIAKTGETPSVRSIVRNNGGTWEYNSNVTYTGTTWTSATVNEKIPAIEEAMSVAANQMDSTQMAAVADAEWPAFGDTFDLAIILYSDVSTQNPAVHSLSFTYDGSIKHVRKTNDYEIDFYSPSGVDEIRVKSPASGGPRNARVYVSG